MVPLRRFSAPRDKNFPTELLLTPPPLIHKPFATGNFLKHSTKGFLYEVFRYYETNFWRNIVILPPSPLSSIKFFETRIFFETMVSLRNDSVLTTQQFWRKIVIPALSLIPYVFRYQKFSETQKGSPTSFFGTETIFFRGIIVLPFCIKHRNEWWNWRLWKLFEN